MISETMMALWPVNARLSALRGSSVISAIADGSTLVLTIEGTVPMRVIVSGIAAREEGDLLDAPLSTGIAVHPALPGRLALLGREATRDEAAALIDFSLDYEEERQLITRFRALASHIAIEHAV